MGLTNGTGERPEVPQKPRWKGTLEVGAGTFSKPHMRVLVWWIEMANFDWPIIGLGGGPGGLDCPVVSERSNGAVREINRFKYLRSFG